jgi:hypothetical protein
MAGNLNNREVIVAKQWEPNVVIIVSIAIDVPLILIFAIPIVICISWSFLLRVGYPFASTVSG